MTIINRDIANQTKPDIRAAMSILENVVEPVQSLGIDTALTATSILTKPDFEKKGLHPKSQRRLI